MRKASNLLFLLVLALSVAAMGKVVSIQAASSHDLIAQEPEVKTVRGELTKVDLESQTLTIKLENGDEVQFAYDSDTMVEGRENGVQGLASDTGTMLTVHYKEDSGKKIATKIVIKKSEG